MMESSKVEDFKSKADTNPISKKVSKILESKVETDKEMIDALQTISTFFGENTLHNRRNLRRDIERRSLQINVEFLEEFKKVKEELDRVANCVSAMNDCCTTMTQRLECTKAQTRDLITETTKLQMESKRVEKRAEIANAFLAVFQLKPDEVKALKGNSDGGITKEFFNALNRAKEIHTDCKQLLHGGQHIAGLEIMDAMAAHQEAAYELLYRWIQRECRLFNVDSTEVTGLVCEAFHALENRPVLFKYSLDEFCTARRNYIVRAFIDALTKGGPGGVPKPIELLSHDPLRYVNDMLAWIHQALASEKEFLQHLLKECSEETVTQNIPVALSQITDGLYRPFKVRVEQVLGGENGPVLLYKLSNLFRFYYNTIKQSLTETASLLYAINELRELLTNVFHSSLNTNVHRLLEKMEQPSQELVPVQGLHQVLLLLRDVLESHDAVLVPVSDKKENFSKIFTSVLDPLLTTLHLTSTQLNPIELAVYMLNCLHSIVSILSLYEYTDERLEMLQAQIEVHVSVLISEQASYILTRTGMIRIYNLFLQHQPNQGPASKLPNLSTENVKGAVNKFDLFLASPDSYQLTQNRLLASPKMKELVHHGTMDAIVKAYQVIYDKVIDQHNLYEEPFMIVGKTVEQIKQLLM